MFLSSKILPGKGLLCKRAIFIKKPCLTIEASIDKINLMDLYKKRLQAYRPKDKKTDSTNEAKPKVRSVQFPEFDVKADDKLIISSKAGEKATAKKGEGPAVKNFDFQPLNPASSSEKGPGGAPPVIERELKKTVKTENQDQSKSQAGKINQNQQEAHEGRFTKLTKASSKHKMVAKYLFLLPKEKASAVLKNLEQDDIEVIIREMLKIKRIDKSEAEQILKEMGGVFQKVSLPQGGIQTAEKLLTAAFGREKATGFLKKARPDYALPFAFLEDVDFHQVMALLEQQSASILAVILNNMSKEMASRILPALPVDKQREIIRRIAKMERPNPEVVEKLTVYLQEGIRKTGNLVQDKIDGKDRLAQILKHMNYSSEQQILDKMDDVSADIVENIRSKLFSLDIVYKIEKTDFQNLLRQYTDRDLAMLLKGQLPEIKQYFLSHLSSRRAERVKEESAVLGAVLKKDAEEALNDFMALLRHKQQTTEIRILDDEEYV